MEDEKKIKIKKLLWKMKRKFLDARKLSQSIKIQKILILSKFSIHN